MREISGEAKTLRQLLSGMRYSLDYYQREYKWQSKQVRELIEDLTEKFLEDYNKTDERKAVQNYGHYFLGSIILSLKSGQAFIIDGQQRLTTLTLLLIYLHNCQGTRTDRVKLEDLIYAEKYGQRSFNIDVDERTASMDALFNQQPFDTYGSSESVRNIVDRYGDIEQLFPDEIDDHALPYFADWLIENVHLVEITAFSDDDAYFIFETMNDRGLSLSPLDMLKGYILANITDDDKRLKASLTWKESVTSLTDAGKDEDTDAFKAWLRSQYADSIRERKKGAQPRDFDRIGTEFHRWVRENGDRIRLKSSDDYFQFIKKDMKFYARHYQRMREASQKIIPGFETVYFNACNQFTLQYPLLLAPLTPHDDDVTIDKKIRIVAAFIDILIARRAVNYLTLSYSAISYAVFLVMKEIRSKQPHELADILALKLDEYDYDLDGTTDGLRRGISAFSLNQWSKRYIKHILARMTDHIERQSGLPSHFEDYVAKGKNRFEIEHIWANHPERHKDEFSHEADFSEYRNRIGGLLLLPKSFNSSYGDLPYKNKLEHYFGQNLLAKSLHPKCYDHNPGFINYLKMTGLPFKAYSEFKRADLDERQVLYQKIAEEIWDPARMEQEVTE